MITTTPDLRALLRHCHVQASFEDVNGRRRRASADSQLALLRSLGVDIESPRQAGAILRDREQLRSRRGIEPVMMAWNGQLPIAKLTLPARARGRTVSYELKFDNERIERSYRLEELNASTFSDASSEFAVFHLPLPPRSPLGYHALRVEANGQRFESLIISAPRKAYVHDEPLAHDVAAGNGGANGRTIAKAVDLPRRPLASKQAGRGWGSFLPLYALRSSNDWGAGDFGLLRELAEWIAGLGGSTVGTLPLFAAFLDEPYEASPYRPATRLFWNEFYIDVEAVPELLECQPCRELIDSRAFHQQIESVGALDEGLAEDVEGRAETLLAALLRSIAASPAALVLVNLEDLWFETRPQNFPGTSGERPNWTRKARLSLEEFRRMPDVRDLLEAVNAARKRKPKPR